MGLQFIADLSYNRYWLGFSLTSSEGLEEHVIDSMNWKRDINLYIFIEKSRNERLPCVLAVQGTEETFGIWFISFLAEQ